MTHEFKIERIYFEPKLKGEKSFEIRYNKDREFQKGDVVLYREIAHPGVLCLNTGRELWCEITFVTSFQQKEGWVVFGDRICEAPSEGKNAES